MQRVHILVVGGTGFLGTRIGMVAHASGHTVTVMGRGPRPGRLPDHIHYASWDTHSAFDERMKFDAVVNLAGANLFGRRWTRRYKRLVHDSRVELTKRLVHRMQEMVTPPGVLVNASAVGYYGLPDVERLDESNAAGSDFLAGVCHAWEQAASAYAASGRCVVHLRFGIMLGRGGGALGRLVPIFKLGAGGTIGAGKQPFPWVSTQDAAQVALAAATDSRMAGAYNVVAPVEDTNKAFTKALGVALRRPTWFPVPPFVLALMYGEGAKVLTEGRYVVPARLLELGYVWTAPDLARALATEFGES